MGITLAMLPFTAKLPVTLGYSHCLHFYISHSVLKLHHVAFIPTCALEWFLGSGSSYQMGTALSSSGDVLGEVSTKVMVQYAERRQ